LARLAIVLQEGDLTFREVRLGRILDFFGVPWKRASVSEFMEMVRGSAECVVFGPICAVAAALEGMQQANRPASKLPSFYAYAGEDRGASERGIRFVCRGAELSLQKPHVDNLSFVVSKDFADLAGPLAGLEVSCRLSEKDNVLAGTIANGTSSMAAIMSAGGLPVFVRRQHSHGTVFFNACSQMVDIDQPAPLGFYDVKEHFCSAVPLVMFVRFMFPDVVWRPQEHGACLIIDDPLLKSRYGYCDFTNLRDLMQRHQFTTNISFIPWNWRRTSAAAADFFRRQPRFSLSVHGCDHIAGEFGAGSLDTLDQRAKLAQSRMRNHEGRTGLPYDPVMVFPQGVFSSKSPEALKHNGFLAAVNTETLPVDSENSQTRIRDVWDLAIMSYSGFPIFTRRYASHGLENFAFDLLLGKPCLIVAHHDFFKDGGVELIDLIEKLCSLNAALRWRPLGEVVRRSCRRRTTHAGAEEVEMYGTELCIDNTSNEGIDVTIRKRESQIDLVGEILSDGKPVTWTSDREYLVFSDRILPRSEKRFRVNYRKQADGAAAVIGRSLQYEISVAVRRALSEFRDDYLSKHRLLSATAERFKGALTRNN
jgi:hypothetical protein